MSHTLISPLDSEDLINNTCSSCHADIKAEDFANQALAIKISLRSAVPPLRDGVVITEARL